MVGKSAYDFAGDWKDDSGVRYTGNEMKIGNQAYEDEAFRNALLDAQIYAESFGIPNIVSHSGAQGLAQFMPITWKTAQQFGWVDWGADPTDPAQALKAQRKYMDYLYNKPYVASAPDRIERLRRTVAAYNMGHGNLYKRLRDYGSDWENHIPDETKQYLEKIFNYLNEKTQTGNYTPVYIRT